MSPCRSEQSPVVSDLAAFKWAACPMDVASERSKSTSFCSSGQVCLSLQHGWLVSCMLDQREFST